MTKHKTPTDSKNIPLRQSLAFRMPLQLLVLIAVVLTAILLVLRNQLVDLVVTSTKKEISSLAEHNASLSSEYFSTMQTQAASLAKTLSQLDNAELTPKEKQNLILNIMSGVLKDDRIFGVYTAWEPDLAFSNTPDGLSFYMYRSDSEIKTDILNDYAVYNEGDYYSVAKTTKAAHITEPYAYELTNGSTAWLITISNPILDSSGRFLGVSNCDIMADTINQLNYSKGEYSKAYSYLLSYGGSYLAHTENQDLMGKPFGETMKNQENRQEILALTASGTQKQWEYFDETLGEKAYIVQFPIKITGLDNPLSSSFIVSKSEALLQVDRIFIGILLLSILELVVIAAGVILILKRALRPMGSVIKAAESMERGELNIDIQVTSKDEFGRLAETFRRTTQALSSYIYEISENLNRLAQGDLRIAIEKDYKGDFEQIKTSLSDFTSSLSQTLSNINTASEQVSSAASQVSSGAQVLASGSTVQAASIEELSAAFEKISYQAAENSSNVKTATQFVGQVESGVDKVNQHMQQLTDAMANIGEASDEISSITRVIEDIASQTNLLALNAAIEAARAGAAGKGFAVVADEVRNLAAKSSAAAKQTTDLIARSAATVKEGSQMTEQTFLILQEVGEMTNRVTEIIEKIDLSSSEQALAIEQVQMGLSQVSSVVQTNAATSEENSATSEEMYAQAIALQEEVSKFKL